MNRFKSVLLASLLVLSDMSAGRSESRNLSPTNTIGDILRHPAFSGHAPRVLPWDDRRYDEDMTLNGLHKLLPYHSAVDVQTVLGGLNRIIDDAAGGHQVFYDIYSHEEKKADPTKQNTGLFFFRGKPGAPFAIVSPGGGFAYVGSVHEGFPYAVQINEQGYNVFVLKYRVGQGGRVATQDLATGISFVFMNRDMLGISTEGYSVWGSSAGARMAAFIGSQGVAAFGGDELPKPAAVIMAYTAHSDRSESEPPTFAVVGADDEIAPPSSMESRIAELRKIGTPVEYREFPAVGHGFGTGTGTSAEGWIKDATRFWERSR